jgi:hypothetical protein
MEKDLEKTAHLGVICDLLGGSEAACLVHAAHLRFVRRVRRGGPRLIHSRYPRFVCESEETNTRSFASSRDLIAGSGLSSENSGLETRQCDISCDQIAFALK